MSESIAITKLMQEAEEAASTCTICLALGHRAGQCPHLLDWLQMKTPRQRPGIPRHTVWLGFWLCVATVLVGSAIWRWLY